MSKLFDKLPSIFTNIFISQTLVCMFVFSLAFSVYGYSGNGYLFACMLMVFLRGMLIDLIPHKDFGVKLYIDFIKSLLPCVVSLLAFGLLLEVRAVAYFSVICVVVLFSLFNQSLLFLLQKILTSTLAQLIVGFVGLFLFTSNYFAIGLIQNYISFESQSNLFYTLACLNPFMMIANSFGVDVFHANQLYQVFGSVFIVEKLKLLQLIKFYLVFSVLFFVLGSLFPKQKTVEKSLV